MHMRRLGWVLLLVMGLIVAGWSSSAVAIEKIPEPVIKTPFDGEAANAPTSNRPQGLSSVPAGGQLSNAAQTAAPALPANCANYAGLTHKIVGCVREVVDASTTKFFVQIGGFFSRAVAAVATLAVIVYGIMLSLGMVEKLNRDTYILIFKLVFVFWLITNSPWAYGRLVAAMDELVSAVVLYTPANGTADSAGSDYSQANCLQSMVKQAGSVGPKKHILPWLSVDCLIDSVIGIKVNDADSTLPAGNQYFNKLVDTSQYHTGPSRGLINLFFATIQTSVLGIIFTIVGFFFIYGLMMLVVRAMMVYLACYIGLALLMILSPIFIPLILFRVTKDYFDKWWKMLISFVMQPVVLMAYIIFSIAAVDLAAYSGDYSIMYRIAGDASRQPGFNLNAYMMTPEGGGAEQKEKCYDTDTNCTTVLKLHRRDHILVKTENPTDAPINNVDTAGFWKHLKKSDCTQEKIDADDSPEQILKKACASFFPQGEEWTIIDWEQMAKIRNPGVTFAAPIDTAGQQIQTEVVSSLFFCVMVVFILNGLLSVISMVITDLFGDLMQSPNMGIFGSNLQNKLNLAGKK